jgi:hypothetical protein
VEEVRRERRGAQEELLMRAIVFAFLALAGAGPARAQLVGILLKPDAAKKHEALLVARGSAHLLVGDPVAGLEIDVAAQAVNITGEKQVVLCVADLAIPESPLYEGRDKQGRPKPVDARKVVLSRRDVDVASVFDKDLTLTALRDEYLRRRGELDAKRKALASVAGGSAEWFALHRKLIAEVAVQAEWLRGGLFAPAAPRFEKEQADELKKAGAAASKARLDEASKIVPAEVPADLAAKSKEGGKGDLAWKGRRTRHLVIFAPAAIKDAQIDAALQVGERLIESFRSTYVDPELGPDGTDPVPAGVFVEYCVVPDEDEFSGHVWEKHYGMTLAKPRERSIKVNHFERGPPGWRSTFRSDGKADLEGWVAHMLAHAMVNTTYNRCMAVPTWIGEGFACRLSIEHLTRNSVTCIAFAMPTYAKSGAKEGTKALEEGLRGVLIALAMHKGPSLSVLQRATLVTMDDADLAKAWSFVDWLADKDARLLGEFVRAAVDARSGEKVDLERFRPHLQRLFGRSDGDVYDFLDAEWKKHAERRAEKR